MVITLIINARAFSNVCIALRQAVDLSHFGNSGESVPSTKEFFDN